MRMKFYPGSPSRLSGTPAASVTCALEIPKSRVYLRLLSYAIVSKVGHTLSLWELERAEYPCSCPSWLERTLWICCIDPPTTQYKESRPGQFDDYAMSVIFSSC